jgi:hypothetical protein
LDLLRVLLAHHVLLVEAAIEQVVGVVEEVLGFVFLLRREARSVWFGSWADAMAESRNSGTHLVVLIATAVAEARGAVAHGVVELVLNEAKERVEGRRSKKEDATSKVTAVPARGKLARPVHKEGMPA